MRVLILTVQKSPSFGACLQTFALYKYICGLGHDCQVIDLALPIHPDFVYTRGFPMMLREPVSPWSQLKTYVRHPRTLLRHWRNIIKNGVDYKELQLISKCKAVPLDDSKENFDRFESLIRYTKRYRSIKELYANPPEADVYVTGSDQCWNPTQPWSLEPFFLTFVRKGKKMTYATSIGVSSVTKYVEQRFSKWLKGFDHLSLREQTGVEIIQKLTSLTVNKCCDPTFLLPQKDWMDLAGNRQIEEHYIYVFLLYCNKDVLDRCQEFARKTNRKLIVQDHAYSYWNNSDYPFNTSAGPQEFINLIRYADFVVTDSFHGTVFSLIMSTPFRTLISDASRSTRILELLEDAGATQCLLESDEEIQIRDIDFMEVGQKLAHLASEGRGYLQECLS